MESLGVVDSAAMPRELDTANQGFFVNVLKDTVTARYTGRGNHSNDVGTVRGDKPVPSNIELYYFEVTVVNAGEHGKITVGLVSEDASSNLQPGAEPGSYGYHGSDGRIFHGSTTGREYAPSFTTGDVIGCGLDVQKQEVFFTKNGTHLGIAFRSVRETLYPAVGLHSFGEVVRVNFGQEPFRFDVQALLAENRARERTELEQIEVDELVVNRLVRDYLLYCGYSKTLSALDAATGIGQATYESSSPWPKTVREQTAGTSGGGVQRMDLETPPPRGASISFAPTTTYQWQGEQKRDEDEEEFDEEEGDDDDSVDDHDLLYTGSPRFARSEHRMPTPPGPVIPQTIVRDAEFDLTLTDGLCDTRDSPYWGSLEFRSAVRSCILKGDVDEAVRLCRAVGAPPLERNKQVWCQLKCLQFTNFVRTGDVMQAIQHARKELYPLLASTTAATGESASQHQQHHPSPSQDEDTAPAAQTTSNGSDQNGRVLGVKRTRPGEASAASSASPASPRREVASSRIAVAAAEPPEIEAVRQVLGLLAYDEPQASPLSHLLSPVHAEFVADSVNDLLLGTDVRSYRTGLHLICSQLLAVKGALREAAGNKGKIFLLGTDDGGGGEESHNHDLQYSAFPIEDAVYEYVRTRV